MRTQGYYDELNSLVESNKWEAEANLNNASEMLSNSISESRELAQTNLDNLSNDLNNSIDANKLEAEANLNEAKELLTEALNDTNSLVNSNREAIDADIDALTDDMEQADEGLRNTISAETQARIDTLTTLEDDLVNALEAVRIELEAKIANGDTALQADIDTLEAELNLLKGELATTREQINNEITNVTNLLNEKIATNVTNIAQLRTDLTQVQQNLTNVENNLTNQINGVSNDLTVAVTNLQQQITNNDNDITGIVNNYNALKQSYENYVTSNNTAINNLTTKVNNNTNSITALNTDVNNIKNNYVTNTSLQSTLNNYVTTQTISADYVTKDYLTTNYYSKTNFDNWKTALENRIDERDSYYADRYATLVNQFTKYYSSDTINEYFVRKTLYDDLLARVEALENATGMSGGSGLDGVLTGVDKITTAATASRYVLTYRGETLYDGDIEGLKGTHTFNGTISWSDQTGANLVANAETITYNPTISTTSSYKTFANAITGGNASCTAEFTASVTGDILTITRTRYDCQAVVCMKFTLTSKTNGGDPSGGSHLEPVGNPYYVTVGDEAEFMLAVYA